MRHKVETEDNPEELFRELMKVSEDGRFRNTMARLKQQGQAHPQPSTDSTRQLGPELPPAEDNPQRKEHAPNLQGHRGRESPYVAFGQLLLEDDEDNLNPSRCRTCRGPVRCSRSRTASSFATASRAGDHRVRDSTPDKEASPSAHRYDE